MKFGILLAAMMMTASLPASAQSALVIEKLEALNSQTPKPSDAAILAAVTTAAAASAAEKKQCQPASIAIVETTPITGARVILAGVLNNSLRNAWSVYARHVGCAGTDVFRYAVLELSDKTLKTGLVNEGYSYANLSIMRDTSGQAAFAAYAAIKKIDAACAGNDMKFGRTRIDSEGKDLGPDLFGVRYTGSWTEIWQFSVCGRTAEVPITFSADGDGGAYTNIKGAPVVVLPKP